MEQTCADWKEGKAFLKGRERKIGLQKMVDVEENSEMLARKSVIQVINTYTTIAEAAL